MTLYSLWHFYCPAKRLEELRKAQRLKATAFKTTSPPKARFPSGSLPPKRCQKERRSPPHCFLLRLSFCLLSESCLTQNPRKGLSSLLLKKPFAPKGFRDGSLELRDTFRLSSPDRLKGGHKGFQKVPSGERLKTVWGDRLSFPEGLDPFKGFLSKGANLGTALALGLNKTLGKA